MAEVNPTSTTSSVPRFINSKMLLIVSIVTVAIIVDVNVGLIADFIADIVVSSSGIALFIGIAAIFAVGQHFILRFVSQRSEESRARALHLNVTNTGVRIVYYVLTAIFVVIIVQIFATSQYNTGFLTASSSISYGLLIVMFALLTKAFLSWYKYHSKTKGNAMMLVFAAAMPSYLLFAVLALTLFHAMLQEQPEVVASDRVAFFPVWEPETLPGQIQTWYGIVAGIAFFLIWVGVVMLLYPHAKRFGKAKFWAIMGFALLYHTIQIPLFELGWYTPSEGTDTDIMNNILMFSVVEIFTGIIFGGAFLSIARTLKKGSLVRDQMIIAAYGILMLQVSGAGTASQAAYPPFGLAAVSSVGLASYMLYVGIYSSAMSVSQDTALRQSIRKSIMEQSKLLENIGKAQMEQELHKRVLAIAKKNSDSMIEETGVQPSINEDQMKQYLEEVLEEIKARNR
jgi:hypothetical protein